MKKLLTIGLLIFSIAAQAQQFGNEWIDYNKTYYKFKVAANGLYRIPAATLAAANLGAVDAAHFQLWNNGVEVPLFISISSGPLGAGDYIEFWGQMNDGKPDNPLYRTPDQQLSNAKSLFSDSSAYFLTVNTAGGNKRLTNTPNNLPGGVTPEPYFIYRADTSFAEQFHYGASEGSGVGTLYMASFEGGEGWASVEIGEGQSRTYQKNLYPYTGSGAPDVMLQMNVMGSNVATRRAQLTVNGNMVFDQVLSNFGFLKLSKTLPPSVLNGGNETFSITNTATVPSRMRVASIGVTYARQFNFGGASNFRFSLPARGTGYYLEITNFNFSGGAPVLYDLANGKRYIVDATNPALLKVFLPAVATTQELVLTSQAASNLRTVPVLEPRTFVNYAATANQGNYLMITEKSLLAGSNGTQPVNDYRNYRASAAGGAYNAKVYLIDQLTDQFAYGIQYHSLSIRNFLRFARARFASPPRQAFLIGKGVSYVASRTYPSYDLAPQLPQLNLVPTFGYPSSDVLLSAEGSSSQPLTPIGRLSVVNGDEITLYLGKIKEYEQQLTTASPGISESAWKKNVAHLVGASDDATISLLDGLLQNQKTIIQGPLYGANVSDFVKSTSGTIQNTNNDRLRSLINNGIGLLTYFGHSSSTSLDYNLENPSNYTNRGRYPLFNMMGCNVGDIFGYSTARLTGLETISEKYLLAKDGGSIGMMAGTSVGYVSTLDVYNTLLYTILSGKDYGKTIGELMLNTIAEVFKRPTGENEFLQRAQCEEYTLNGDPAIRLYQFDKPDYALEDASIAITPNFISVAEPEFTVKAKINNLGKAVDRKVIVELKRTFPNQSVQVFRRDTLDLIRYADSITYTLPIDPTRDKGASKITVSVDPENTIEELNEGNNTVTKDIFIYEDELRPVYPYDYAIVSQANVKLTASTANALTASRTYMMELDTTELFNSPLKISKTQTSAGGIVEFLPDASLQNNTVYYWRVAAKPDNSDQPHWNSSSFLYLNGSSSGFNQSHYYQMQHSGFSQLMLKEGDRAFHFDSTIAGLTTTTGFFPYASAATDMEMRINDFAVQRWMLSPFSGADNVNDYTLRFYVIDNRKMKVWENVDLGTSGMYGSVRPIPAQSNTIPTFFQFKVRTAQERKNVMDFIDLIPKDFFVVITNSPMLPNVLPSEWLADESVYGTGNTLYHKLVKEGVTVLDQIKTDAPFIIFLQKGSGRALKQRLGAAKEDKLVESVSVNTLFHDGRLETPVFGVAKAWDKLIWDGNSAETSSKDQLSFDIYGISNSGAEVLLKTVNGITANKTADISDINAQQYPKIRLKAAIADTVDYTPYQLKSLRLLYTPAPEGAIAPNLYLNVKDTLEVGEPLNFAVAFKNISSTKFDSIAVKLSIRDKNNVETIVPVPNQKALLAGDTIKLSVPLPTKNYRGNNTLFVDFNPGPLQPEQYAFNNFLYKNFFVKGDSTGPYMDVTFDGVHILNKDIVSSKPDVLVKLTDDAKWLLLDDPSLIQVQLLDKTRSRTYTYKTGTDTLQFTPAGQGSGNTATMNFRPRLEDGDYELQVAAKDRSGNEVSQIRYKVGFQVINKPMISNMLNYPNPFTTATAFVFTLTGSEVPQNIRIQILTITGKIVREITTAELGPLRIGRNITDFRWDGTDQYGQKLANGVYLYRVITNLNGKSLEKYKAKDDNTDKYFNKGYGKMYLMR
ncbi:C25 family cysteine peptidase [Niabella sp. CC-SYL272]|uniref:putative type IX secretion system sortase PorU2 n=1 Tax=Niabella agricola TaxID=2891571 RepID=UPI001F1B3A94|nr:C25 family cysteine peptidase [Niabella agricola]MCF3107834.1 C25 family cysteine peptidase [Niabella agricola]